MGVTVKYERSIRPCLLYSLLTEKISSARHYTELGGCRYEAFIPDSGALKFTLIVSGGNTRKQTINNTEW